MTDVSAITDRYVWNDCALLVDQTCDNNCLSQSVGRRTCSLC